MLPFRNDVFDVVMSCETLEHVPPAKWETFLSELCRVSRRLVFVTTTDETAHRGEGQRKIEEINPFQKFQAFPPLSLFEKLGFQILQVTPHHIKAFWVKKLPHSTGQHREKGGN